MYTIPWCSFIVWTFSPVFQSQILKWNPSSLPVTIQSSVSFYREFNHIYAVWHFMFLTSFPSDLFQILTQPSQPAEAKCSISRSLIILHIIPLCELGIIINSFSLISMVTFSLHGRASEGPALVSKNQNLLIKSFFKKKEKFFF